MAGEIVVVDRISRIYYNRKFFHYPIRIRDVVRKQGSADSYPCGRFVPLGIAATGGSSDACHDLEGRILRAVR